LARQKFSQITKLGLEHSNGQKFGAGSQTIPAPILFCHTLLRTGPTAKKFPDGDPGGLEAGPEMVQQGN